MPLNCSSASYPRAQSPYPRVHLETSWANVSGEPESVGVWAGEVCAQPVQEQVLAGSQKEINILWVLEVKDAPGAARR